MGTPKCHPLEVPLSYRNYLFLLKTRQVINSAARGDTVRPEVRPGHSTPRTSERGRAPQLTRSPGRPPCQRSPPRPPISPFPPLSLASVLGSSCFSPEPGTLPPQSLRIGCSLRPQCSSTTSLAPSCDSFALGSDLTCSVRFPRPSDVTLLPPHPSRPGTPEPSYPALIFSFVFFFFFFPLMELMSF